MCRFAGAQPGVAHVCNAQAEAVTEMDVLARCGDAQVCVYTTLAAEMKRNRALQPKSS